MATFGGINVHSCTKIKAEAKYAVDNPSISWLELSFDDGWMCKTSIFMPYERAKVLAIAINGAEEAYAEPKDAPSYVGKDHRTQCDAKPGPDRFDLRSPDEKNEHRLTLAQVL